MRTLELPARNDTDGQLLAAQTTHSIIRDMLTRTDFFFPKYGVQPQMYGMQANNGFQVSDSYIQMHSLTIVPIARTLSPARSQWRWRPARSSTRTAC